MRVLVIFALAACTSARSLSHISEHTDAPTIHTVPEMAIRRPGFANLAKDSTVDPAVGLSHSFLGVTDVGFIDYSYNALEKASSVHVEDYADIFDTAILTCTPAVAGASPERLADGTISRNDVSVTVTFTDAALALPDYLHFLRRITTSGALITFDHTVHATNPSFAPGSTCSEQLPFESSIYFVDSAAPAGSTLVINISPAKPSDAHHMMDIKLNWDPDTAREVNRRRAANLPLGTDARRRLRPEAYADKGTLSMNWNGKTDAPAATQAVYQMVTGTPGLLTCENCFAYVVATYSIVFQFCIGIQIGPLVTFFTSDDFKGSMRGTWGATSAPPNWVGTTATTMADCVAALAPWVAADASTGKPNVKGDPTSFDNPNALSVPYNTGTDWDLGFNIDGFIGGSAGFNFGLKSIGFDKAGSTTSCSFSATDTDSSKCATPTMLFESPEIAIPIVTGLTIKASAAVSAAVIYSGTVTGTMSVGAGATVTGVKLGGKVQVPDMVNLVKDCVGGVSACATALTTSPNKLVAYNTFPLTYYGQPMSIKLTAVPVGAVDATLWMTTTLKIDGLPIIMDTMVQFAANVKPGSKTSRRLSYSRELADSLTTCPATSAFITITENAKISGTVGPLTLSELLTGMGATDISKAASTVGIGSTVLVPKTTLSASASNGADQPLVSGCVAMNVEAKGTVGGAGSTAWSSTGGGGTGTGGVPGVIISAVDPTIAALAAVVVSACAGTGAGSATCNTATSVAAAYTSAGCKVGSTDTFCAAAVAFAGACATPTSAGCTIAAEAIKSLLPAQSSCNSGCIAGAVIGSLVGVALIAAVVWFVVLKKPVPCLAHKNPRVMTSKEPAPMPAAGVAVRSVPATAPPTA